MPGDSPATTRWDEWCAWPYVAGVRHNKCALATLRREGRVLEGSWHTPRPASLASPEPQSGFMGEGVSVALEEEASQSLVITIKGQLQPEHLPPQNENNVKPRVQLGSR